MGSVTVRRPTRTIGGLADDIGPAERNDERHVRRVTHRPGHASGEIEQGKPRREARQHRVPVHQPADESAQTSRVTGGEHGEHDVDTWG